MEVLKAIMVLVISTKNINMEDHNSYSMHRWTSPNLLSGKSRIASFTLYWETDSLQFKYQYEKASEETCSMKLRRARQSCQCKGAEERRMPSSKRLPRVTGSGENSWCTINGSKWPNIHPGWQVTNNPWLWIHFPCGLWGHYEKWGPKIKSRC